MWGALQRFRKENTQVLSKIDGQKSEPMVSKAKLDLKVYFDLLILGEALLGFEIHFCKIWASLIAQLVKNLPAMQETPVQFLGQEDPLEKG